MKIELKTVIDRLSSILEADNPKESITSIISEYISMEEAPPKKETDLDKLLDHINRSFKEKKGANYPLSYGPDKATLKRLLGLYDVYQLMALWDNFLDKDWSFVNRDGETVRVGHSIMKFQVRIAELLDTNYKAKANKYADKDAVKSQPIIFNMKEI